MSLDVTLLALAKKYTDEQVILGSEISPSIRDGIWYIGEINTGVKAAGTTPHIGENNNWWIGEVDTGVLAEGKNNIYIGSGDMPDDFELQIDPDGNPLQIDTVPTENSNNLITSNAVYQAVEEIAAAVENGQDAFEIGAGLSLSEEKVLSVNDEYINTIISNAVSSVYHFKGSLATFEDLETIENPSNGDVYNIIVNGMNYAWVVEEENGYWDALGLNIDTTDNVEDNNDALMTSRGVKAALGNISYNDLKDKLVYREYVDIVPLQTLDFSDDPTQTITLWIEGYDPRGFFKNGERYAIRTGSETYEVTNLTDNGLEITSHAIYGGVYISVSQSTPDYGAGFNGMIHINIKLSPYYEGMTYTTFDFSIQKIMVKPLDEIYLPANMTNTTEVQQMINDSIAAYDNEVMELLG